MGPGWKSLWIVLVGAVLVQIAVLAFPTLIRRQSVAQPIAFNHKKHAGELSLPCTTCHQSVETQTFAGLPEVETCMGCHAVALTLNPEEEKIRNYASIGERIPWQRIYRVARDAFFSHRRHVALGKIDCIICHGKMVEQTAPPGRPLVDQTMTWCINCHREKKASVDCNACHR